MHCPVPGCGAAFRTLKKLASHLKSVVRRNRCGTYNGSFDFECTCGELLHTRQMIFAHNALHSIKTSAIDADISLVALPDVVEPYLTAGSIHDEQRDPDEIAAPDGGVSGSVADFDDEDVMFHQLMDTNGDEDESNDSDSDRVDEIYECKRELIASAVGLKQLDNCPQSMKTLLQLYRFCLERNITVKGYRQLRDLPMFEPCHDIPLNLKHLRRKVEKYVEEACNWPRKRIVSVAGNDTPYMSIDDCVAIWLAVPCVVNAVRDWGRRYLPLDLVDVEAYEALLLERNARIAANAYSYETIADGSFYVENVRDAIPLFEAEYLRAVDDGIEVLVCTFGLYEDNFGKNLNSLVSQTLFCTTLIEASTGEADLTGLSTLVSMLADASLTKSHEGDKFRKGLIDSSLKQYQKGKRWIVNGQECLIIGLTVALMGDTPALKAMIGLSPSISSTCYVKMPCMLCEVLVDDLRLLGPDRTISTVREFLRSNGDQTGPALTAWLRELMKERGFLRIPEIARLHNQPSPCSVSLDTMHILFRGVLVRHFCKLMKKFNAGKLDWQMVSKEFSMYCRINQISAFCKFTNKNDFKLRMTAGSMREFTRVSTAILRKLGLVPEDNGNAVNKKRLEYFNYWCVHVRVADMLERRALSCVELRDLSLLIDQLLEHWRAEFPLRFWTINVHYYRHFVDKIRALGSLRVIANNSREHLIQKLKPYYRNSNHTDRKEMAIHWRYRMSLFFCVYDLMVNRDPLKYNVDYFPDGHFRMNFYLYNKVVISNGLSAHAYSREDYGSIGQYYYDNRGAARFKVDYCLLRAGHFVSVCRGTECVQDIGSLVTFLTHNEEMFLAYKMPVATICDDNPLLFFRQVKITQALQEDVLYLVPVRSFLKRKYVYPVSGQYYELIL